MRSERRQLLRAQPARYALPARFVSKKLHRIHRLLSHVSVLGVNHQARAQRLRRTQCPEEIQFQLEVKNVELGGGWIEPASSRQRLPAFVIHAITRQTSTCR